MPIITLEERDRRWKNVRLEMEKRGLDCLIIWGGFGRFRNLCANLTYMSNFNAEGYMTFPLKDEPTLFIFQGDYPTLWVKDNRTGHPRYSKAISQRIKELHLENGKFGMVGVSGYESELGFPYATYTILTQNFPGARFFNATDIIEEAQVVKSPAEIRCLEVGSEIGIKTIRAIINSAKPGAKEFEVRAAMMDTLFREGSEPSTMILFHAGKEVMHGAQGGLVAPPKQVTLKKGFIIHTEFDIRVEGYKAQFNQPFAMGKPNPEWQDIFKVAVESLSGALEVLKPGITIGELNEAFLPPIKKAGYVQKTPNFHGLGLSLGEPLGAFPGQPDYEPKNDRVIVPNMTLEFEPPVISRDFKRGTTIGCPILVTDNGYRLLAKGWKPEVIIIE